MMATQKDNLPWLLMPCVLLTLCSVTLLVPRRSAQAAPPLPSAASRPVMAASAPESYDDGDGDELLEHWGDPKYSREERLQMAGGAGGLLLLLGVSWRKRTALKVQPQAQTETDVEMRKAA